MNDIPWDQQVELFEANGRGGDLKVRYTAMSLRDAVEAFVALSHEQQQAAGIGLKVPISVDIKGRAIQMSWFNAQGCRVLADRLICAKI